MASGRAHDHGAILCAIAWAVAGHKFAALGALAGLMLSPDQDLFRCNANRRWGIVRFIWWPYSQAIPHRHWLSHGPVIGTLTRYTYLRCIIAIAWLLFDRAAPVEQIWQFYPWEPLFLCGLASADILHLLADRIKSVAWVLGASERAVGVLWRRARKRVRGKG